LSAASPLEARVAVRLAALDEHRLRRRLRPPSGIDLSSNDYLGLARHPLILQRIAEALGRDGFGSTGSRLLRGHREAFANAERFPEAEATYAEEYEDVFPKLPVNSSSYIIIVTRGHRDDMRVLRWAVNTPARYIAMIGSKRKTISVVHELEKEGISREAFDKVFAPMGLEIGAEMPEEIAISVVAEMIAVRRAPDADWRQLSKSIFSHDRLKALLK